MNNIAHKDKAVTNMLDFTLDELTRMFPDLVVLQYDETLLKVQFEREKPFKFMYLNTVPYKHEVKIIPVEGTKKYTLTVSKQR